MRPAASPGRARRGPSRTPWPCSARVPPARSRTCSGYASAAHHPLPRRRRRSGGQGGPLHLAPGRRRPGGTGRPLRRRRRRRAGVPGHLGQPRGSPYNAGHGRARRRLDLHPVHRGRGDPRGGRRRRGPQGRRGQGRRQHRGRPGPGAGVTAGGQLRVAVRGRGGGRGAEGWTTHGHGERRPRGHPARRRRVDHPAGRAGRGRGPAHLHGSRRDRRRLRSAAGAGRGGGGVDSGDRVGRRRPAGASRRGASGRRPWGAGRHDLPLPGLEPARGARLPAPAGLSGPAMIGLILLALTAAAPCIRLSRAGTQVQGDVRVCPGRYRVADPAERGVLIAASSGTRIDLTGVIIESGDSLPDRFVGIGVASKGVDAVTVVGGTVRGYRFGVRVEGGRNHRLSGIDVSNSRHQVLRSTPERADTSDRLDVSRLEAADEYGAGLMLRGTTGASVTGVVAHAAQNGISLVDATASYVADNDVGDNSGWGIQLYRSSHNSVLRNDASRTRRCPAPGSDCSAAAILVREGSDSNTLAENDLTASTIGVLMTGEPPISRPSVGNLVYRNDASLASVVAFAARMAWGVSFLGNRAGSAGGGFEQARETGGLLRGTKVI